MTWTWWMDGVAFVLNKNTFKKKHRIMIFWCPSRRRGSKRAGVWEKLHYNCHIYLNSKLLVLMEDKSIRWSLEYTDATFWRHFMRVKQALLFLLGGKGGGGVFPKVIACDFKTKGKGLCLLVRHAACPRWSKHEVQSYRFFLVNKPRGMKLSLFLRPSYRYRFLIACFVFIQ